MLPFALLGQYPDEKLGEVISQISQRFHQSVSVAEEIKLRTFALLLVGVRFSPEVFSSMFPDLSQLRESTAYKMILDEGRTEGRTAQALEMLLELGSKHLGEPPANIRIALEQIHDAKKLGKLANHVWGVETWADLLASVPND